MRTDQNPRPGPALGPRYVLRAGPGSGSPSRPVLDAAQAEVAAHRDGPLLVLAGPGTGKTTTLVESVAALVEDPSAPLRPDQILVLTFSRRAALELRERITRRVGRASRTPMAWTFHAFSYALVRGAGPDAAGAGPAGARQDELRLLSAPEQDVAVHELLRGAAEGDGRVRWPERLVPALATRGMAEELRGLLARARALGMDPVDLARAARASGRDDWAVAARFFADYLDVLDAAQAIDYSELVTRAVQLAEQPAVRARLRARFAAVFVDEYQDTDPVQERLLRALAGDGRHLVAVGDPDQSIYAFRGAEVGALLEFPERFAQASGAPAPVRTLQVSRRAGATLLAASRSLTTRMPVRALPRETVRAHRELVAAAVPRGDVRVRTFPTAAAEASAVADLLRRAHLDDGVDWSRMAVLCRSGLRSIPLLRRVLGAAGVPVEVAGDELPLGREPAVAPLLLALRAAAGHRLGVEEAQTLLLSPLGGADPAQLRELGRELRAEQRAAGQVPDSSGALLRAALEAPERLAAMPERLAEPVRRLGVLLADARVLVDDGGTGEQALWALWSGSRWPRRLERAARAGGAAGRAADRDLDAVCALFDAAVRLQQRPGVRGVSLLVDEVAAQEIPADTLAERAVRGSAVRLLTAHRSKGLEWDVVAVMGVQEGSWPDLRRRGSLLEPDRLGPQGAVLPPAVADLVAEERRLFYVAVTRARRLLVVSAVESADEDGERPSRFLDELGVPVERLDRPAARRPLTVAGLVGELRRTAADPASDAVLREAALETLAVLAGALDASGERLVPAAHPARWWGLHETTDPGRPMRRPEAAVPLSGSSLTRLTECPLRWFLEHEVHADQARSAALGLGSIVHVLADRVARGELPAQQAALEAAVDSVWSELAFEARWQSAQQRAEAGAAVTRFLRWHEASAARGRELLASEQEFSVQVETPDGPVLLRGSADRLERDTDGLLHVVDFKTGRTPTSKADLLEHPQLGVYQRAVVAGAFAELAPEARPGGAELVQLRIDDSGLPKVQQQPALPEHGPSWVDAVIETGAAALRQEEFVPRPGDHCPRCVHRRSCPAQPEGAQVVA